MMKNRSFSPLSPFTLRIFIHALAMASATTALANPLGESVAAGQADFARSGSQLTVTQHSQNAIINWQSFNIAGGELTRFLQNNSNAAVLNRVTGGDMSV